MCYYSANQWWELVINLPDSESVLGINSEADSSAGIDSGVGSGINFDGTESGLTPEMKLAPE